MRKSYEAKKYFQLKRGDVFFVEFYGNKLGAIYCGKGKLQIQGEAKAKRFLMKDGQLSAM